MTSGSQGSCVTPRPLTGVLTRSKTHGPDKRIQRKPIFLDTCCWFAVPNWCDVGFNLLQDLAPYERDYLLPSTGHNHAGIREAEMSYDAGLATTTRLHRGLVANGQQLLVPALCVCWTPHSHRSFMATCCAALGVAKAERNVLGRWHRTSLTPTSGFNAHSSRNSNSSWCQSSVVVMTSAQSWEKGLSKNLNPSWRREEWTEE